MSQILGVEELEEQQYSQDGNALLRQAFEKSFAAKTRWDMSWQVGRMPYGWPGCDLEDMQHSGFSSVALHNTKSMIQQVPEGLKQFTHGMSRGLGHSHSFASRTPRIFLKSEADLNSSSPLRCNSLDSIHRRDHKSNGAELVSAEEFIKDEDSLIAERISPPVDDVMEKVSSIQPVPSHAQKYAEEATAASDNMTEARSLEGHSSSFSFESQVGSMSSTTSASATEVLNTILEEERIDRAASEGALLTQPPAAKATSRPPIPSRLSNKTPFVNIDISSVAAGIPLPPISTTSSFRQPGIKKEAGSRVEFANVLEKPPLSALGGLGGPAGLQLRVDSYMSQGSWDSGGWAPGLRELSLHLRAPSDLQIISPDDLVKERELGRGCHGKVWLAKWRGVDVALKELISGGVSTPDSGEPDPFDEAQRLASLRHPCIIAMYGIVAESGSCAMAVEFLRMGNLRSGLKSLRSQGLCHPRIKAAIALQAARGMEYLHDRQIVHFDLKCENFLCDLRDLLRPVVKIGDLGLSQVKKDKYIAGNMRGTLPFMAPELFCSSAKEDGGLYLEEDQVTEKVDVYSFGVCLWEIWTMCAEQPYSSMDINDIFAGVITGSLRPSLPTDMDPEWARLAEECWRSDPNMRPSFTEVAERLDACLQRWRLDSDSASQLLSKINPEIGQHHNEDLYVSGMPLDRTSDH